MSWPFQASASGLFAGYDSRRSNKTSQDNLDDSLSNEGGKRWVHNSDSDRLGVGQFPWFGDQQEASVRNPMTPKQVKIRLSKPGSRFTGLSDSSIDESREEASQKGESSRNVVQALKEIWRKRASGRVDESEDSFKRSKSEHHHNLYMSQLENDSFIDADQKSGNERNTNNREDVPNGEENRNGKRSRLPNDTAGPQPKRRNNEILSSLSSSVGLLGLYHLVPVRRKRVKMSRKREKSMDKVKEEMRVKMTDTMEDKCIGTDKVEDIPKPAPVQAKVIVQPPAVPPQEETYRRRSPIRERNVTDAAAKTILLSALSKFAHVYPEMTPVPKPGLMGPEEPPSAAPPPKQESPGLSGFQLSTIAQLAKKAEQTSMKPSDSTTPFAISTSAASSSFSFMATSAATSASKPEVNLNFIKPPEPSKFKDDSTKTVTPMSPTTPVDVSKFNLTPTSSTSTTQVAPVGFSFGTTTSSDSTPKMSSFVFGAKEDKETKEPEKKEAPKLIGITAPVQKDPVETPKFVFSSTTTEAPKFGATMAMTKSIFTATQSNSFTSPAVEKIPEKEPDKTSFSTAGGFTFNKSTTLAVPNFPFGSGKTDKPQFQFGTTSTKPGESGGFGNLFSATTSSSSLFNATPTTTTTGQSFTQPSSSFNFSAQKPEEKGGFKFQFGKPSEPAKSTAFNFTAASTSSFSSTPSAPTATFGTAAATPSTTVSTFNSSMFTPSFSTPGTSTTGAFGSTSMPTFGAAQPASSAPQFGTTQTAPTFGTPTSNFATQSFGSSFNQSTPFTFGAQSTPKPAFNFTASTPQQPQQPPGMFQFGAQQNQTTNAAQPFSFNAGGFSFPTGGFVPGVGGQMFNMGSGSVTARSRHMRNRKKTFTR
ncbi:nuclear pore complex protein DDB_G0274915-like isoform X2 [Cimex lectularius]|uniref:Uncharacterized protein n=1 Tax=Cimex lectularius TaxID=79782 RepID=A0A8I6SC73_CIMLE|nr:nuclear pore complex protein DDB_G0274915-like isoform X2 [Cimex lectularius]